MSNITVFTLNYRTFYIQTYTIKSDNCVQWLTYGKVPKSNQKYSKVPKSTQMHPRHKQYKHMGVRYSCGQCEYQATKQSHITTHKQSKHMGVRYSCDQCEYQSTIQSNLTRHKQSKHMGVHYSCDQCEYQATNLFALYT